VTPPCESVSGSAAHSAAAVGVGVAVHAKQFGCNQGSSTTFFFSEPHPAMDVFVGGDAGGGVARPLLFPSRRTVSHVVPWKREGEEP
jgi:hypothetical protein